MELSGTQGIDQRFAYPNWQGPFVWYGGAQGDHKLDDEFVVIDVETTGLEANKGARIIELSAIRTDGSGKPLDSMTTLINPRVDSTGAEFIHGISLEMLVDAPTFAEVWPHLAQFLSGSIFVAHHAKFDESFIAAEAEHAKIEMSMMPGLCTYRLAKDSKVETANHKLATLSTHFGLNSGVMHSAYDDALTVVQLLPHLLEINQNTRHYTNTVLQVSGPTATRLLQRTF